MVGAGHILIDDLVDDRVAGGLVEGAGAHPGGAGRAEEGGVGGGGGGGVAPARVDVLVVEQFCRGKVGSLGSS